MNNKNWDILLDKCIDRLNEGASLEDCIAEYPEHAKELEPLLWALWDAREICSTMPEATIKSAVRQRLGAALSYPDRSILKIHWSPRLLFNWSRTKAALAFVLVLALFCIGLYWALNPKVEPVLANIKPANESVLFNVNTLAIVGHTQPDAMVWINGQVADVESNGNFSFQVFLDVGLNVFNIIAIDENGNQKIVRIDIFCIQSHEQHSQNNSSTEYFSLDYI